MELNRSRALELIDRDEWIETSHRDYVGHHCTECNTFERATYTRTVAIELIVGQKCHRCWYWIGQATAGGGIVTPTYTHYRVHEPNKPLTGGMKGFGGREWMVFWFESDGSIRAEYTDNLWHQGDIPRHLWDMFQPTGIVVSLDQIKLTVPYRGESDS